MTSPTTGNLEYFDSSLGKIKVTASNKGITSILFVKQGEEILAASPNHLTELACTELQQYFTGQLKQFSLPLDVSGTQFQQQVWQALLSIPYGTTCSYADIANRLNNPKAVRAVGAANGKNPVSIVVPCHRVIGANGRLTGYAGGLDRKERLLNLESPQPQVF